MPQQRLTTTTKLLFALLLFSCPLFMNGQLFQIRNEYIQSTNPNDPNFNQFGHCEMQLISSPTIPFTTIAAKRGLRIGYRKDHSVYMLNELPEPMDFYTDGISRLEIDGQGNIGIGSQITANPNARVFEINHGDASIFRHVQASNANWANGLASSWTATNWLEDANTVNNLPTGSVMQNQQLEFTHDLSSQPGVSLAPYSYIENGVEHPGNLAFRTQGHTTFWGLNATGDQTARVGINGVPDQATAFFAVNRLNKKFSAAIYAKSEPVGAPLPGDESVAGIFEAIGSPDATHIGGLFIANGSNHGNHAIVVPSQGGNVGIGTASPQELMEIDDVFGGSGLRLTQLGDPLNPPHTSGKVLSVDANGTVVLIDDCCNCASGMRTAGTEGDGPDKIAELEERIIQLEMLLKQSIDRRSTEISSAQLMQNFPNPFSQITQIDYFLPETARKASMQIVNIEGTLLQEIPITQKGNGSIKVKGNTLSAGIYFYRFIVDGVEISSKKMILTE